LAVDEINELQEVVVPERLEQTVDGSIHPLPVVLQPAKKVAHSASV